ncbi:phage late control D family protein [Clostridium saccharobutylicum]|uniref:Uncharacterized protein n=1 Tax=Clostridium saccharobutylicum TaxID=169679 RepID=A0A1S8MT71_CLOSA|nr:phage late control D family protein [Clostridium saccharobutylicum]OOM07381.1 hypothetical protein CLOSAC_39100 [Clostridium saccharobutylicum]
MGAVHSLRVESPYKLLKIEDIKVENKANEHGYLYLKALIDDSINFQSTINASTNDKICVYEEQEDKNVRAGTQENSVDINVADKENSKILFSGIVQNIRTSNVDGIYYLEIQALTVSFELDIKEKSRSFQNLDMTYDELIAIILSDYPETNFSQCICNGEKIGRPLFQYKETDWSFLKRIASELKSELYCDIINIHNMFYFGRPSNTSYELEDTTYYKAHKNLKRYHEACGRESGHDTDYFYYEIEKKEQYNVGDEIYFKNKQLYVNQYSAYDLKDEVIYKYKLCRKNGIWQTKLYNSVIGGAALEGKVLAVDGEKVKLHLNIDETQNEDEAAWFPYAPPTGNIMYSMPIVGTSARLYFPNEESEEPIVTGCVRSNGSSCAKTSDTTKRYFGTEHGSEIEMTPGAVNIKGGSKEPLSLSIDENVGVTLKSPKNLNLNADDDIIIKTPASVKLKAQSQIGVTKTGTESGFSVETDMHIKGNNVIKDGSDRETYAPFDDEPREGKKPDPPPPPKEEKKGFNWGKLALVAVATVAIVASVATFGLGTTLAVAAVAAVAVSAAAGATKAAQNNIDSQLAKNGGDNSQIDYGEVLKAEFFGAVTGAKDMLKTEACAGTDWAIQTFMGMVGIINQGRKLLPWNRSNMINQIEIDNTAQRINNDTNGIHQFFLDNAPDKQAFEDAEYVLDVATIVDGVKSIPKIIKNFPNKFSIGELSLPGLGKTVPVLCVDGSASIASAADLASIGGAGGSVYNMASNCSGGSGGNGETSPRYGERQISDEEYDMLRKQTPTQEIRDQVNEGHDKNVRTNDEVLTGKTFKGSLEADHIVSMDKISKMDGFGKLTKEQQLEVLNNPENFIGLSKSANTSKGAKSYEEWTHYKKGKIGEIEVEQEFRNRMMEKEREMERKLQKQIDNFVKHNEYK